MTQKSSTIFLLWYSLMITKKFLSRKLKTNELIECQFIFCFCFYILRKIILSWKFCLQIQIVLSPMSINFWLKIFNIFDFISRINNFIINFLAQTNLISTDKIQCDILLHEIFKSFLIPIVPQGCIKWAGIVNICA